LNIDFSPSNFVPSRARRASRFFVTFEASGRLPHLTAKIRHFRDGQAGLLGDDHQLAFFSRLVQRGDQLFFLRSLH